MTKRVIVIPMMLFAMALLSVSASGQDFTKLLKAVDKVETNLMRALDEERAERQQQYTDLQKQIKNQSSPAGLTAEDYAELASLREAIESLRTDVESFIEESRLAKESAEEEPTVDHEYQALTNRIAMLETETELLRGSVDGMRPPVASTEEGGEFLPQPEAIPFHEESGEGAFGSNVVISGFADAIAGYQNSSDDNTEFGLGQAEIGIESEVSDRISVALAVAYEGEHGVFELGAAELGVNLYSGEETFVSSLDLVTGQFDVPFGIDYHVYPAFDRKLVTGPAVTDLTHGGWNDAGIQFNMETTHGNFVAYVVNGFESSAEVIDEAMSFALGVEEGEEIDTSPAYAFGWRLGIAPSSLFEVGGSFATGYNGSGENEMLIAGVDAQSSCFNFDLKGEWIVHSVNRTIAEENNRGFYFQSMYSFLERAFVVGRYGSFKPENEDWIGRYSFGGGYEIVENAEVRFESSISDAGKETQNMVQFVVGF